MIWFFDSAKRKRQKRRKNNKKKQKKKKKINQIKVQSNLNRKIFVFENKEI